MNRRAGLIVTIAGIALFGLWLWSGVESLTRVECEACLSFEGRSLCRTGLGANDQDATAVALQSACALLASGVTESFACGRVAPDSVRCRER